MASESSNIDQPHLHCPGQPPFVMPVKLDRSEARRSLTGKDTMAALGSESKIHPSFPFCTAHLLGLMA